MNAGAGDFESDYPLIGETLGLWVLERGIGRGGMGEVYRGRYDFLHLLTLRYKVEERGLIRRELAELPREEQSRLASELLGTPLEADAAFAIKVCSARSGTAGHRRFIQEAELARRLGDHPYVVSVHAINPGDGSGTTDGPGRVPIESGRFQDVAFMAMDLAVRDYDHTRLSITEAVHVVRCIALALDHAHRHGIVHRDLKPENILGCVDHPYLTDFGIAKELDQSLGLTRTGQIIGTLDYMSPEQATDAKAVDHRSDVYSLGVVLYEFATRGHLPYIHLAEREAALSAIRSERFEPKWPRDHIPDFPRGLERIIVKAIAHRPEERYQEMSELIGDLDRYSRGEWIAGFTRIAPRRLLRHAVASHPRLAWSVPAVAVLLLLLWVVPPLLRWLDDTRSYYRGELDAYAVKAEAIEEKKQVQMLDPDQAARFAKLRTDLQADAERYPELYARLRELDATRRRERWLKVAFGGDTDAVSARAAKARLEQAAQLTDPNWRLTGEGLVTGERTVLRHLAPYGDGQVVVRIVVELREPEGFALTVTEAEEPRNRTRLTVDDGRLRLRFHQDELDPQTILERRIRPGASIDAYLSIDDEGVRAYLPHRLRPLTALALTPESPARVILDLPRGSVLRLLHIWPKVPPEEESPTDPE